LSWLASLYFWQGANKQQKTNQLESDFSVIAYHHQYSFLKIFGSVISTITDAFVFPQAKFVVSPKTNKKNSCNFSPAAAFKGMERAMSLVRLRETAKVKGYA